MQSLKAVEAEYLYRKVDDGTGKALSDVSAEKKKISLEAFQIIKVIGKGNYLYLYIFHLIPYVML
jgi:hypothetical protein